MNKENVFLLQLAKIIWSERISLIRANERDVQGARKQRLSEAFLKRLALDEKKIRAVIGRLKSVAKLNSGLRETIESRRLAGGVLLKKVRVPLGTILVIYESRPEVTIDVAALCVKSGNKAILKGGSEARQTNLALYQCIRKALASSGFDQEAVRFISTGDRSVISKMLKQNDLIDLVIARGGYGMVKAVMAQTKIPVLAHAAGGARVFVDKSTDLRMAERIIINAKISNPGACNSLDTILVHKKIAKNFLPKITAELESKGVKVLRNNQNWDKEMLELTVGVKIIKDVQAAAAFINKHGKQHSEGIVAADRKVIKYFTDNVDAAGLFINCSPRLHDGYVFGLGAEMGIATGKLHARGPVGLKELTTYQWEAYGKGQIR